MLFKFQLLKFEKQLLFQVLEHNFDESLWRDSSMKRGFKLIYFDPLIKQNDVIQIWTNNQKYFHEIAQMLGAQTWSMGKIIQFLKDLEKKPERKGRFPYKAVRAVDINDSKFKPTNYRFVEGQFRYFNMNPRLIICLFEKNKLILTTYKIIYPEKYVQPD